MVVGVTDYNKFPKLKNSVHDAKKMCEKLESKGAKVFLLTNCDREEFEKTAREHRTWLSKHPNALGFFFFAGHAVEYRNQNWLALVSKSEQQTKFTEDSVSLTTFIAQYV